MPSRSTLEGFIKTLGQNPFLVLESALLLPGRSKDSLAELENKKGLGLPRTLAEAYAEVGGAHISWRLSPDGYEKLYPGAAGNKHRYDVSGNLDLLSPEEAFDGFTGDGWRDVYRWHSEDYYPVDFASDYLNMGFGTPLRPDVDRLLLNVLYDDLLAPLEMTLAEYLQRGAELMFLNDWQLTLLNDEEYAAQEEKVRDLRRRLASLAADAPGR